MDSRALEEVRQLFAYDRWANTRMLEAVASVPPEDLDRPLGGSFPTLRLTVIHILASEWVWLQRWRGESPAGMPNEWSESSLERIQALRDEVEREQIAFLDHLQPPDLERVIHYRSFGGVDYQTPLWQVLRHVVNHATYHRGQVTTLLRQLGAEAVGTDLVTFFREARDA